VQAQPFYRLSNPCSISMRDRYQRPATFNLCIKVNATTKVTATSAPRPALPHDFNMTGAVNPRAMDISWGEVRLEHQ
jgi:hypothetical protein